MVIGKHHETLTWEISPLEDGIAGYLPVSWLRQHNPDVNWEKGTFKWRSDYCKGHCLHSTPRIKWEDPEELVPESAVMAIATVS